MKCPHCSSEIETQQKRAAESRWASMTKAERAAEMSRVRKLGVKRAKTKARAKTSDGANNHEHTIATRVRSERRHAVR